ncbi:MAG: glycosyltransferase family 2 protein [Thermoleophilia bacterium]|nr:glycosyltransferase family 2 protein [Thermoleophilia bacterium]
MSNKTNSIRNNAIAAREPDVSIIIVNWNLKDYLLRCLESLQQGASGVSTETIIIDNASSDGSAEAVRERYPAAKVLQNDTNEGFSRANNQAMEIARGRYFFLLNNDTFLYEPALKKLVEFMDAHPEAGICGPRVLNEDGTLQFRSKGRYPSIVRALGHFFLPESLQKRSGNRTLGFYDFGENGKERRMDWVSGCALMVRSEVVNRIGKLDSDMFMYCEDVDWCFRAARAGWSTYYVPSARVLHYGGMSMSRQTGRAVAGHKTGLSGYYGKYHGSAATALFRSILWLGYGVQACGWLAAFLRGNDRDAGKIKRMLSGLRPGSDK